MAARNYYQEDPTKFLGDYSSFEKEDGRREIELDTITTQVGERGHSTAETQSENEVCIMVAGKPGNGKSTALNNIFGLKLPAKISAHSVTKQIERKHVTKNGIHLCIIDTPGLGALDIDKKAIVCEMAETIEGLDYTIVYCLSVAPSSRLTEVDRAIIKNLHGVLGKVVWDKCVILLTFSDTARRDSFSSEEQIEEYKEYLKEFAQEFHTVLKECGADVPQVKTVFEYESNEEREEENDRVIVAVPVGKDIDRVGKPDILPDIIVENKDWTNLVFTELMKKTDKKRRKAFFIFKYGAVVLTTTAGAAVVGGVAGGGLGAAAGAVGGPLGFVAGGAVGAATGVGVGAAVGLTIGAIVAAIKLVKKHSKTRREK